MRKRQLSCLAIVLGYCLTGAAEPPIPEPSGIPIAIVIDDLGYDRARGRAVVALPGRLTLAVLPHSPHGAGIAELAHGAGKEVMLHAPMSNLQDRPLDDGALTVDMDRVIFLTTLAEALASIPHVRGLNNHMGSLLTQEVTPMQWLMAELKSRRLYFVDSRTSGATRALETARRYGLPSVKRDVFLDNEADYDAIAAQFRRFLAKARRQGYGLAIGHPYPETLQVLADALPDLSTGGFRLVSVSDLLSTLPAPTGLLPTAASRPPDGPSHVVERLKHRQFE